MQPHSARISKEAVRQHLVEWMERSSPEGQKSFKHHSVSNYDRVKAAPPRMTRTPLTSTSTSSAIESKSRRVSTTSTDSGLGSMSNSSSCDSLFSEAAVSETSSVFEASSPTQKTPVMQPGSLLIFESSSAWGQFVINKTAGDELIPMGHVAMMIDRVPGAPEDSTDPKDLLFVTTDIKGVGIWTLEEIMATYDKEYASAWVLPMKKTLDKATRDQFMADAKELKKKTTFYNVVGAAAGLGKQLLHISTPLPDFAKAKGQHSFCSQAVAQVITEAGMQPKDMGCHEVSTASLAYLIDENGEYIFRDQARHIHDYFPDLYFDDRDESEFELRPSRVLEPEARLEKTFLAASRSKVMKGVLAEKFNALQKSQGASAPKSASEVRLQQLAGLQRNARKTVRRENKPLVETVTVFINGLQVPVPVSQCVNTAMKPGESQEIAPGLFALSV